MKLDKLLVTVDWTKNNIPEFADDKEKVKYDVEIAPEIIILDDEEKFKSNDGQIFEIEVRGKRTPRECYFRVKDIADQFEMKNLQNIIVKENTKYEETIDYKYLTFLRKNSVSKKESKNKVEKELYLTYRGMLKVLFTSRTGKANTFVDWATDTLFAAQMGTLEQKTQLASKTLGITAEAIREVFNTTASTIPCVYLYTVNTVDKMRKSMTIPIKFKDDNIVLKFGFTDNLKRRTVEHEKYYSKVKGSNLKLTWWSYIDPQYISTAEIDIKEFFKLLNCSHPFDSQKELVVVSPKILPQIEKRYKQLGELYGGHIKEMTMKIRELENKIENT